MIVTKTGRGELALNESMGLNRWNPFGSIELFMMIYSL